MVYSSALFVFVFTDTQYDFAVCIRAMTLHYTTDAEYQM